MFNRRLILLIAAFAIPSVVPSLLVAQSSQTRSPNSTCSYTTFQGNSQANLGSQANGLNDKDYVAGVWSYDNAEAEFSYTRAFLRSSNGDITQVPSPGRAQYNFFNGVNDSRTVVGYYQNNNTYADGFEYANGVFTALQYPGSVYTEPYGINNNGDIVGWYSFSTSDKGAFLYSGGQFTSIVYPGAFSTVAMGINDLGEIVGYWSDSQLNYYGFIYSNGEFQTVSYPGEPQTVLSGVNDGGEIVGYYVGPGPEYLSAGFIYRNGNFHLVNIPGSSANRVLGINSQGHISGFYDVQNQLAAVAFIGTGCH